MTSEYQAFRKKILEDLTREDPQMRYKDKMTVVTKEWKEYKESSVLQPLSPEDMVNLPVTQTVRRRLKNTVLENVPGVLCLLGKLLHEREHGGIIQSFKHLFKTTSFYQLKFNGMDIWDMLIVNNGGLVMKDILENYFNSRRLKDLVSMISREGRMGSFLNVLVGVIYEKPDARLNILALLIKMICSGVSPNTEFQCGEYKLSLPDNALDNIRYVGTSLTEPEYSARYPMARGSVRFVGDTVFGFLLQNMCNLKIKNFTLTLLETGLVNLSTIIHPYSLSTDIQMDYLGTTLKFSPAIFQNQVSCVIYKYTSKTVLLRTGALEMFRKVASDILKTNWRGMTFFNSNPRNIIHMLMEDGFLEPSGDLFYSRLLLTPHGRRSLQTSFEIYQKRHTIQDILKPDVNHITRVLRNVGSRILPSYHNDSYFSTSEPVDVESPYIFVSDDDYVFCRDELEYLLKTGVNPFNRREFSENEIARMQTMEDIFKTYWYMFDISSRRYVWLTSLSDEISEVEFARLIDSMFELSDLFSYGCRISDIMENLNNNALTVLGFNSLVTGVGTILNMISYDITIDQCISFARGKEDPYDIEEINTYYGIIFSHMNEAVDFRRCFLQWIFLILETTDKFSSSHVMTSRLLSLALFIQMIKSMK